MLFIPRRDNGFVSSSPQLVWDWTGQEAMDWSCCFHQKPYDNNLRYTKCIECQLIGCHEPWQTTMFSKPDYLTTSFTSSILTPHAYFMFSCPLQFLFIKQVNDLFYWGSLLQLENLFKWIPSHSITKKLWQSSALLLNCFSHTWHLRKSKAYSELCLPSIHVTIFGQCFLCW